MLLAAAVAWVILERSEDRVYSGDLVLLDGVVPSRAGVALPPGTPIGAGLEVAEGSYLLGGPLPYLYSTMTDDRVIDEGFEAYLVVTQPIRSVVERYRAQAVKAGFHMTPVTCSGQPGGVECGTACDRSCGFSYDTGYRHGRELSIVGEQGASVDPPVSFLHIDHHVLGDPPYPTADFAPALDDPTRIGSVPDEWPPLPDVGDPILSFSDFEVAPGTILLAHGLGLRDRGSMTTAILEVTGDIDDVVASFAAQPEYPEKDPDRTRFERDGQTRDEIGWTDGHGQGLRIYDLASGPTILVLTSTISD